MTYFPGLRDRLHDHVALDEIELYAEVLIAVAETDHPLSPAEIDRALGVSSSATSEDPPPPARAVGAAPGATPHLGSKAPTLPEPTPAEPDPEVRIVGPVPPARNGHDPTTAAVPLHSVLTHGGRANHPLCGPFPPRFVPWRAWHL